MTDGLEQYHKLAREQEGLVNANCLAHARRHFANAIKAMGKGNGEAVKLDIWRNSFPQVKKFCGTQQKPCTRANAGL